MSSDSSQSSTSVFTPDESVVDLTEMERAQPLADLAEMEGAQPLALMTALDTLQQLLTLQDEAPSNVFPFDLIAKAAALPPLLAPAQRREPPPKLDTLGHDVLECIFDHIRSGSHLRKCLRVNRTFRSHANPRLYERINIDIDDETEELHKELISPTHSGVQHVRVLGMYPCASGTVPPSAHRWIKTFLGLLGKEQLREVNWICEWSMPLDLLQYVWETQPNICRLHLGGTILPKVGPDNSKEDTTQKSLIAQLDATLFERVTELELTPNCIAVAQAASKSLNKFTNIDTLVVDGLIWNHSDPSRESTDEDSAVRDKFTTTLFDHRPKTVPRTLKAKWAGLRSLWISDINMRYCRDTWFAYLNLENLDYLHLSYCRHADVFLTELMRTQPPQLKDFCFIHDGGPEYSDRTLIELEDFLNMTKGRLRRLEICLRNTGLNLHLDTVNRHRATLESLTLDIYRTGRGSQIDYLIADRPALEQLLTGCDKLTQLAIALPPPKSTYRTFRDASEFRDAFDTILLTIPLSVLNILNIPAYLGIGRDAAYYSSLQPQLESLASDIFAHIRPGDMSVVVDSSLLPLNPPPPPVEFLPRPSKPVKTKHLDVLAFGTRERQSGFPVPRYFVEGEVKVMHKSVHRACPVSLHGLVTEGLEVDILDYDWRDFGGRKSRREWADLEYFVDADEERRERIYPSLEGSGEEGVAAGVGNNEGDGEDVLNAAVAANEGDAEPDVVLVVPAPGNAHNNAPHYHDDNPTHEPDEEDWFG